MRVMASSTRPPRSRRSATDAGLRFCEHGARPCAGLFFWGARQGLEPGRGGRMKPIAAPSASWLVVVVLVACSSTTPEQIEGRTDPGARPETGPTNEAGGAQSMQPMLEQIRADAAQRAGVTLDQVKVLT